MKNTLLCENCYWEGVEEQLQLVWIANPSNPKDEYLKETRVCPKCQQEGTLIDINNNNDKEDRS